MSRSSVSVRCIAVLLAAFSSFAASAQAPLPKGAESYTQVKFNTELEAYLLKQLGDYRKTTVDPKTSREQAEKYIGKFVHQLAGFPADPAPAATLQEGRQLLQLGVRDPRVLAAIAFAARKAEQPLAARQTLEQILAKSASDDCPAIVPLLGRVESLQFAIDGNQTALQIEAATNAAEALQAWLIAAKPKEIELRFAWNFLRPFFRVRTPLEVKKAFYDRLAGDERIDGWLRDQVAGRYTAALAWERRGGDWASRTPENQMKQFHETLQEAIPHFRSAIKRQPSFPETPAEMIHIAMAIGDDRSPREWFDEAVARQLDYDEAYYALVNALQPRWGGSLKEMVDFALECLATERFDTNVPCTLGIVIDTLGDEREPLLADRRVFAKLDEMLTSLYRLRKWDSLDSWIGSENQTRSWHAAAAVTAGSYPEARAQFDAVGDALWRKSLVAFGYAPDNIRQRTYALTGPAAQHAVAFRKTLLATPEDDLSRLDELMELIKPLAAGDPHPLTQAYCRSQSAQLAMRKTFYHGEEVRLKFSPDLTGYSTAAGLWRPESEDVLVGISDGSGQGISLQLLTDFRAPYELSCVIQYAPQSEPFFYPTVTVGFYPYASELDLRGAQFMLASQSSTFTIDRHLKGGEVEEFSAPYPHRPRHRFLCQMWPEYIRTIIDGDIVFEKTAPDFSPFGTVSFGTSTHGSRGAVRISEVRIRKLRKTLPPPQAAAEREKYFDDLLRDEPDDARALADRGLALFDRKKVETSLVDFRNAARLEPDNPRYQLLMARSLFFLGRDGEAKDLAEGFLKRNPYSPDVHFYLTDLQTISKQPGVHDLDAALRHAEQASKQANTFRWWEYLSWTAALSRRGDIDEASRKAMLAMVKAPEEEKARTTKVYEALMKKTPFEVREHQGVPLDFVVVPRAATRPVAQIEPSPPTEATTVNLPLALTAGTAIIGFVGWLIYSRMIAKRPGSLG